MDPGFVVKVVEADAVSQCFTLRISTPERLYSSRISNFCGTMRIGKARWEHRLDASVNMVVCSIDKYQADVVKIAIDAPREFILQRDNVVNCKPAIFLKPAECQDANLVSARFTRLAGLFYSKKHRAEAFLALQEPLRLQLGSQGSELIESAFGNLHPLDRPLLETWKKTSASAAEILNFWHACAAKANIPLAV